MIRLKEIFEKVGFEKNQQMAKKHEGGRGGGGGGGGESVNLQVEGKTLWILIRSIWIFSVFKKKDKSGFSRTRVSPSPAESSLSNHCFIYNNRFRWVMENTVDADQLALDLHCFPKENTS